MYLFFNVSFGQNKLITFVQYLRILSDNILLKIII